MRETPLTRPSLLLRIREAEDHQAWEQFVEIYTPLVYGFCRQHGLQDADAADVTQEVMRAVAKAIRKFEYDPYRGSFRSWLLSVTRSRLSNLLAAQRRNPSGAGDSRIARLLEEHPTREHELDWDREYRQRVFAWAVERVRAEVQESSWRAFWQTAMEDCSANEVATQLGLNVSAVYAAKSRVLARLKSLVVEVAEDDPLISEALK